MLTPRIASSLLAACAASLICPGSATAREKTTIPGDPYESLGSAVLRSWDCEATLLDTRGRSGLGFAACLRGLAMDSASGRSTAVVEVSLDSKDPIDLADLKLHLQLDSGRTERVIEAFSVAADHLGSTTTARPELYLPEWIEPTRALVKDSAEDERAHLTLAWNFQTWDPSIDLKFIQLKVVGAGIGGKTRWELDGGLGHDGPWDARSDLVWDESWDELACDVWRVRKGDAGKVSDALTDGAHELPLQLRFDVLSSSDDGEFEVHFPDHKFTVAIAGGKLKVRGREDFTHPLADWRVGEVPNELELVYDGEFVTVRINDEVFGPMAGKQREGKRFRWEFQFEDSKNEIRNLQVAPCTLEDPEEWAEPPAKEKRETIAATPRGGSRRGARSGSVVQAVLSKNGQPTGEVRKKRAKSALEVMTTAASIGQGLMATGQGLSQFGADVKTNMNAMESGDYENMKSSSTQVSVGPCGSSVTRSEASVSGISSGNPTVHATGQQTNYGNPGCADGQPIAGLLPDGPLDASAVCTLTVKAPRGGEVRVGGEVLGTLGSGDRWVAQIAPGTHSLTLDGQALGVLAASAGGTVTVTLDDEATADPPGALIR